MRVRGFNKGAAAQSGSQLAGGVREGDGNCDEGELQLFSSLLALGLTSWWSLASLECRAGMSWPAQVMDSTDEPTTAHCSVPAPETLAQFAVTVVSTLENRYWIYVFDI